MSKYSTTATDVVNARLIDCAMPVAMGSLTYAIGELYRGNVIGIGDALRRGWKLILPLSGTAVLMILGIMLGFILLIIPGIYLMLSWMQTTNVMVFEDTFGTKALRRSTELMRGNRGRVFGLLLVAGLVSGVLNMVVQLTVGVLPVVGPLTAGIAQSISLAFTTSVAVVLYFDIRCRKEQFDVHHLAAQVSGPVAARAPSFS